MIWIPTGFRLLPGPLPVRIFQATVIVAAVLIGLHFFYTWLGIQLLDQGGTVE